MSGVVSVLLILPSLFFFLLVGIQKRKTAVSGTRKLREIMRALDYPSSFFLRLSLSLSLVLERYLERESENYARKFRRRAYRLFTPSTFYGSFTAASNCTLMCVFFFNFCTKVNCLPRGFFF